MQIARRLAGSAMPIITVKHIAGSVKGRSNYLLKHFIARGSSSSSNKE